MAMPVSISAILVRSVDLQHAHDIVAMGDDDAAHADVVLRPAQGFAQTWPSFVGVHTLLS